MLRYVLYAVAGGVLGLCALVAQGQETLKLTNGEWPPYQSQHLPDYGPASRIVTRAFETQGIRVSYGFFPWSRAYYMAERGIYHGSLIWSYTPERAKAFYYSDPFIFTDTVFFYHRDTPFDWSDWSDLRGIQIGATLGYTYGEGFEKAERQGLLTVDRVVSDEINLRRLLAKRITIFPLSLDVGLTMLNTLFTPEERAEIRWHPRPLRRTAYHLILSRKHPDAPKWIEAFNRGLKILKESGEYEQILRAAEVPQPDMTTAIP